jgi:hypothetical protein
MQFLTNPGAVTLARASRLSSYLTRLNNEDCNEHSLEEIVESFYNKEREEAIAEIMNTDESDLFCQKEVASEIHKQS